MTGVHVDAPPPGVGERAADDLLALADDELMMGHRHSEWLGLAPFLEEDLTTASIAQDEIGHARALYELVWPDWADRDADVVRRRPPAWRCTPLTLVAGDPWELALLRHWVYDTIEPLRWASLVARHGASVDGLEALAERVEDEERFHRAHAGSLMERLCSVDAARRRVELQWDRLAPVVRRTMDALRADDPDLARAGSAAITAGAEALGLRAPADAADEGAPMLVVPDVGVVLAEFTEVVAFDPAGRW